ncbi:MAG: hypothetical protein EXR48_06935 [Dehalococcoidia bacterium]|nr:hypothetical protein [Dehalococcoidia bacterium]
MTEVTRADYAAFLSNQTVTIEGKPIYLLGHQRPKLLQLEDFKLETTTIWSFPKRGKWATHRSGYRGNWAPQIARNILLRYSQPGDLVLDQMVGGGTTLVECKLTGRNAIGVDVNRDALMLTMDALNFSLTPEPSQGKLKLAEKRVGYRHAARSMDPSELGAATGADTPHSYPLLLWERVGVSDEPDIRLYHGDARSLDAVADGSVDLVATHPPYANIILYTKGGRGAERQRPLQRAGHRGVRGADAARGG